MVNAWLAAAVGGVVALFGTSTGDHRPPLQDFGDHASTTRPHEGEFGPHASSTTRTINVQCVAAAVATRETSLDTAVSTYTSSINTAYTTRASALASAYAQTDNVSIKSAVKAAWQEFSGAVRAARKGWQSSRESAWQAFRAAVKACGGASSSMSDSSNAGGELSGQ